MPYWRLLAARDCNEVHVEAGPTLCGALLADGLVDELLLYIAPVFLGDSGRPLLHLPLLTDMANRWRLCKPSISASWARICESACVLARERRIRSAGRQSPGRVLNWLGWPGQQPQ